MLRRMACLFLMFVTAIRPVPAQSQGQERPVTMVLQNGDRIEGLLVDFGSRTYRVRVGDRILELREAEIAEVRFARGSRRPEGAGTGTEAALLALERALALNPEDPVALADYARALRARDRADDARIHLERAVNVYRRKQSAGLSRPRDAHQLATLLAELGRHDEAVAALKSAIDAHRDARAKGLAGAETEALIAELLRAHDLLQTQVVADAASGLSSRVRKDFFAPPTLKIVERWQLADDRILGSWTGDLTGDGRAEVVVAGLDRAAGPDGKAFLRVLNGRGSELGPLVTGGAEPPFLTLGRVVREGDGTLWIGGLPNFLHGQLFGFSRDGRKRFEFTAPSPLGQVEFVDLDGDGTHEVLGSRHGGALSAWKQDGRLLWRANAGYFGFAAARFDGTSVVYAARGWADPQSPGGSVDLIDSSGRRTREYPVEGIGLKAVTLLNRAGGRQPRIVAAGSLPNSLDGPDVLVAFDDRQAWRFDLPGGFILRQPNALAAGDLDGDGTPEVVVALSPGILSREGQGVRECFLCVLSYDGKPLWVSDALRDAGGVTVGSFAAGLDVADLDGDGRAEIILGVLEKGVRVFAFAGPDAAAPAVVRPAEPGFLDVWVDAPEMLVSVSTDASGRARLPYVGEISVGGSADATIAAEIEQRLRSLVPESEVRGIRIARRRSDETESELGRARLPMDGAVRLEVAGHPEWTCDFEARRGISLNRTIEDLGRIEVKSEDPTWAEFLASARRLVQVREPGTAVWLRRLPTPSLPYVSPSALLEELLAAVVESPDLAAGIRSLHLRADQCTLEGTVAAARELTRWNEEIRKRGRLVSQVREMRPMKEDDVERLYFVSAFGIATGALRPWTAAEDQLRIGKPAVTSETAEFIARLDAAAADLGVSLGPVQGRESRAGMLWNVELRSTDLPGLTRLLRNLELGARNLTVVSLDVRQRRRGESSSEWLLSCQIAGGYGGDPWSRRGSFQASGSAHRSGMESTQDPDARQPDASTENLPALEVEPTITISLSDTPIDRIIEAVAVAAGKSILILPDAQDLARTTRVSVHVKDVSWNVVLDRVIGQSPDLAITRGTGGVWEVRRKSSPTPR